jgi:hypothetical protein
MFQKVYLKVFGVETGIRSNVDYGSFVYGSATKYKFLPIGPVYNTGVCLATGAFRTIRFDSLYVGSGEYSLSLGRNLLLCNYAPTLAIKSYHLPCGVVFHPAL